MYFHVISCFTNVLSNYFLSLSRIKSYSSLHLIFISVLISYFQLKFLLGLISMGCFSFKYDPWFFLICISQGNIYCKPGILDGILQRLCILLLATQEFYFWVLKALTWLSSTLFAGGQYTLD